MRRRGPGSLRGTLAGLVVALAVVLAVLIVVAILGMITTARDYRDGAQKRWRGRTRRTRCSSTC